MESVAAIRTRHLNEARAAARVRGTTAAYHTRRALQRAQDDLNDMMDRIERSQLYHPYRPPNDVKHFIYHAYYQFSSSVIMKKLEKPSQLHDSDSARYKTAIIFGYRPDAVDNIVAEYDNQINDGDRERRPRVEAHAEEKRAVHRYTRIPRTTEVLLGARLFIRDMRRRRMVVTATQLLQHFWLHGYIEYDDRNQIERDSAIRCVQRFITWAGFARGMRRKDPNVIELEDTKEAIDSFISRIDENEAKAPQKRLRLLFLDESFIHHYHNMFHLSIYDPADNEDPSYSVPHKGRRYVLMLLRLFERSCCKVRFLLCHATALSSFFTIFQF